MKDIKFLILIAVFAVLLGIPAGKANAAPRYSCYGYQCNNLDPAAEGCSAITANAAWKWGATGSGQVRADLRWSSESYCYSNWTRTTNTYPVASRHLKAYLTDSSGNNRVASEEYYYATQIWTNMYNGAYYNCAVGKQGWPGTGSFDATTVKACG